MFLRIVVVIVSLLTIGCGSMGWSRPGTSEAEFYQDLSACEERAARMFPSQQPAQPSAYDTKCSTYGNQTNCSTQAGACLNFCV